jgi:hypothetical protein
MVYTCSSSSNSNRCDGEMLASREELRCMHSTNQHAATGKSGAGVLDSASNAFVKEQQLRLTCTSSLHGTRSISSTMRVVLQNSVMKNSIT